MKRFLGVLGHLVMLAVVVVIAAYWAIKVLTPPPVSAPPPLAAPPPRDPDPILAARMFGLVQAAQTVILSNVQVAGVFSAGKDSSAVLVIDGKPARAFLLGQEVAPGTSLEAVRPDGVTLSGASGQQNLRVPERPAANFDGAPPAPAFTRTGNTLSAPTEQSAQAPRPLPPPPPPRIQAPPPPQIQAPPPGLQPGAPGVNPPPRPGVPGVPTEQPVVVPPGGPTTTN